MATLSASITVRPNPHPANSSICNSSNSQRAADGSKYGSSRAASAGGMILLTARFQAPAKGNTGGVRFWNVYTIPLLARCSQLGPPPILTCSAAWPLQSPQYSRFKAAVGTNDAAAAARTVERAATGRLIHIRISGKNATNQGRSSGRLLDLALVS